MHTECAQNSQTRPTAVEVPLSNLPTYCDLQNPSDVLPRQGSCPAYCSQISLSSDAACSSATASARLQTHPPVAASSFNQLSSRNPP